MFNWTNIPLFIAATIIRGYGQNEHECEMNTKFWISFDPRLHLFISMVNINFIITYLSNKHIINQLMIYIIV